MTIREFIDRRKDRIKIVVVPLLLAAIGLLGHNGRHGPWTLISSIGLGVGILGGLVYLGYVGTIRCPRCQRTINLSAVLSFPDKPQPERCGHCGLSFAKPMDTHRE